MLFIWFVFADYQPSIKLPVSLARQVHAYLIENMIDQAEKNENLINQLAEEGELEETHLIPVETDKDYVKIPRCHHDFLCLPIILVQTDEHASRIL